jgi:hypothetical protein
LERIFMLTMRLEKLKFLVEEMELAMQLALRATDAFVSRTLARHVLVRTENFIAHARQLRKPLNNAGYGTTRFHQLKETYAKTFEEYFKTSRDRLGAHVQDFDFGKRIDLWNDIEIIKIGYFVDGAVEIYKELASLGLPGYIAYASPSELSDSSFEGLLPGIFAPNDGRQWTEIGTDPLAMTRNNTSAILNLTPVHQRAGQLTLIRRWVNLQRRILEESHALVGTTRIIKARLITDIVSFCDCLVTRQVQPGAPQEMDGLDRLVAASGQSNASITAFTTATHFESELASIRQIRDKVGGHLEIDDTHTLQSLLLALDNSDFAAILGFYQRLEAVFLKICHNILFLRTYAVDGQRLYGITPVATLAVPFAGDASDAVAAPVAPALNDESAYQDFLKRWLDGDENAKGDARQFFLNAFMASKVLKEFYEEKGPYQVSSVSRHEFRKVHHFIESSLSAPLSDQDFENILRLLESCRGGAPYVLAEILVRYGRTEPPLLRQWMVCRSLGTIASLPHASVSQFLDDKGQRDPWRIRLDAVLANFKMYIRTEGLHRSNRKRREIEFNDYVGKLTMGMAAPEQLVCSLAFASAMNGADVGARAQPFAAEYAQLQTDIETACLSRLKNAAGTEKAETLKQLIQTNDYVGVCVLLAIDLKDESPRPLFDRLIDACQMRSIETARHDQSVRHLAMCAFLAKDYDEAIRIAQDLAIRNPDLTAHQILVAQILAEKPGAEDEALERIKNIRRFYKITSGDETRLAASEQMAKERKMSSL